MLAPSVQAPIAHLWDRYKTHQDQEARRTLIVSYAPLVRRTLGRMSRQWSTQIDRSELLSCGMIGLIESIEKFHAARNIKFETYATLRIQGAMLDHLRSLDWLPRALRKQLRVLEETHHALELKLARTPTASELAEAMGLQLSRLRKLLGDLACSTFVSLETATESHGGRARHHGAQDLVLRETLPDPAHGPEQEVLDRERRIHLTRAIAALPQRERTVIFLYYFEYLTLRQIGAAIGLSEAAVSTINSQALVRLRQALHREQPP